MGDDVFILFIGGHVVDLLGHPAGGLVDLPVGGLDEAVFVDARIGGQRADQADVRAFRGLDGADAAVVAVVHVAHGEGRALAVQAAGAQGRQAALVGQLGQRVGLVHELGQLGGAEELLDGGGHGPDVDQILGPHLVDVLDGHALLDHALQAGHAHADLVLQQLAHAAQAAVAQVVDVVDLAQVVEQAELVGDGGHDVVHEHVLGHQVLLGLPERLVQGRAVLLDLLQQLDEGGHVDPLGEADLRLVVLRQQLGVVALHEGLDEGEVVADDVELLVVHAHANHVDARVLDGLGHLAGDRLAGRRDDLACEGMHHILHGGLVEDAQRQRQLLVVFIAADMGQVIAFGVEEEGIDQVCGGFHRRRLAGAQLVVDLDQRLVLAGLVTQLALIVHGGRVAGDGAAHALVVAEQAGDLLVALHAHGAQQHRHGQLAGAVDAGEHHAVGIGFILDPRAAVGDHLGGVQEGAGLVDGLGKVHAGRAHQLGDDNALGAVDDERTMFGHQREITHEDL